MSHLNPCVLSKQLHAIIPGILGSGVITEYTLTVICNVNVSLSVVENIIVRSVVIADQKLPNIY